MPRARIIPFRIQKPDLAFEERAGGYRNRTPEPRRQRSERDLGDAFHLQVVLRDVERQEPDASVDGRIGAEQDADQLQLQYLHGTVACARAHVDEIARRNPQVIGHPGAKNESGKPCFQVVAAREQTLLQPEHLAIGFRVNADEPNRQRAFAEEQLPDKTDARRIGDPPLR